MTEEPESPNDDEDGETRVMGAFDPETRTIYLSPDLLDDEDQEGDEE